MNVNLTEDDPTIVPTLPPTVEKTAEEEHDFDAYTALLLNAILIICVLLSYYIKVNRIYYLPERYVSSTRVVLLRCVATMSSLGVYCIGTNMFFVAYANLYTCIYLISQNDLFIHFTVLQQCYSESSLEDSPSFLCTT